MKAPKPISAEPPARPSRPSVTFTAFVVAHTMTPAQSTHRTVGTSNPRSPARTSVIDSSMPVAADNHQANPMATAIVM